MAPGDTKKEVEQMASKVLKLKMWDGEDGGRVLAVPQCIIVRAILIIFFSGSKVFRTSKARFYVVCSPSSSVQAINATKSILLSLLPDKFPSSHFLLQRRRATSQTFTER